jgi:hypothetical protein
VPNPNPNTTGLKAWEPGQSGNPKGRPIGSLTTLLRKAGEKNDILGEPMPPDKTVAEAFAEAVWGHAIKGNASYAAQLLDRLEGRVPNVVNVTHDAVIEVEFGSPPEDADQVPPTVDDGSAEDVLGESG